MSEYRLSRREAVQQMIAVAAAPFVVGCGVDRLLSPRPSVSSAVSSVGPFTLIGAGDQHAAGTNPSFKTGTAMRAALDAYPDAHAFALGDLVPSGTTDEYAIYDRAWGAFKDRTLFLIGNHDEKSDPQATAYYDYVGELGGPRGKGYYAKTFGPWRGYFLNSHMALEEQRDWLDQDLPNWPNHHIMAFWHIPVFATPCNMGGVSQNMGWPGLFGMGGFPPGDGNGHPAVTAAPGGPTRRRSDPARRWWSRWRGRRPGRAPVPGIDRAGRAAVQRFFPLVDRPLPAQVAARLLELPGRGRPLVVRSGAT
jgi:hypothetical protein